MVKGFKRVKCGSVADFGDEMRGDGGFVPAFTGAGEGAQGILDGADKEVDPQWEQNDDADGLQVGLDRRVGQVGKEVVTSEEDQREEDEIARDRTDSAGEGMAPTADQAAADGQHVDRAHRRCRRQSHQKCGRKDVDVGEHHVAADR